MEEASHQATSIEIRTRRPPLQPKPLFATENPPQITFHHPGYQSTRLIDLPAFDESDSHTGLHHGTALLICGIIADNTWNGWLSRTKDGEPLGSGPEDLLVETEYFFFVPWPESTGIGHRTGPYKYPIIPTFREWPFPHQHPPPGWSFNPDHFPLRPVLPAASVSSYSQAVKDRDRGCCVSGYLDGVESAHVCPQEEETWFMEQEMDRYLPPWSSSGAKIMNNPANMLTLRGDIHRVLDGRKFAFTRKKGFWVSHFLMTTANLGFDLHNQEVDIPVHPAFVLSRLAWAVLPRIETFLRRWEPRLVRVRQSPLVGEDKEMTPKELEAKYFKKSRSVSPQKRQRETEDQDSFIVAAVSKRPRLAVDQHDQSTSAANPPAVTPDLVDFETNSGLSHQRVPDPENVEHKVSTEEQRIAALRHEALIGQRKENAGLRCCDYDAAEMAIAAGLEGPKEFGGAHVCIQCLGLEYKEDVRTRISNGIFPQTTSTN
jgi:HNH endonuclease